MPEMRRKGQMIMREIPDAQDKLEQLRVKYSLPFRSAILLKTY
jgi:hypothetical protein